MLESRSNYAVSGLQAFHGGSLLLCSLFQGEKILMTSRFTVIIQDETECIMGYHSDFLWGTTEHKENIVVNTDPHPTPPQPLPCEALLCRQRFSEQIKGNTSASFSNNLKFQKSNLHQCKPLY